MVFVPSNRNLGLLRLVRQNNINPCACRVWGLFSIIEVPQSIHFRRSSIVSWKRYTPNLIRSYFRASVRLYDHRVPPFFLCHYVHNMDMDGAIFVRCLATGIHGGCSPLDQLLVAFTREFPDRPRGAGGDDCGLWTVRPRNASVRGGIYWRAGSLASSSAPPCPIPLFSLLPSVQILFAFFCRTSS
jgi:hypothetical protein